MTTMGNIASVEDLTGEAPPARTAGFRQFFTEHAHEIERHIDHKVSASLVVWSDVASVAVTMTVYMSPMEFGRLFPDPTPENEQE